jgi:hypothetical protein
LVHVLTLPPVSVRPHVDIVLHSLMSVQLDAEESVKFVGDSV